MSEREHPRRSPQVSVPNDEVAFETILVAAQSGSTSAFEQLFHLLSGRLLSFARSRRAADPEGLVNDVFLRVFRKIDSFVGSEPQFNAWVFTIARNQLIDEARRAQRRPVEDPMSEPQTYGPAMEHVEDEALATLGTEQLLIQLDVLTADQRDVVLLRIVADLTIDVIAEALGKEPGAVKALQRRAFRTLAKHLVDGRAYPYE